MALVTLVGEKLAKTGKELVYCGISMECRDCRLKSACLNLEEGRLYKIINVREKKHECKIHEGGVRVVEIEKVPTPVAISQKNVVEGAHISFVPIKCRNSGCHSFRLCQPPGLKNGSRGKITKIGININCPDNRTLREVQLL